MDATAIAFVGTVMTALKNLNDIIRSTADAEAQRQLNEVYTQLLDLRQQAVELDEVNRQLNERLRFKSEEYVFQNPFWYHSSDVQRERPLCPKCHTEEKDGYMSVLQGGCVRRCLTCDKRVMIPGREAASVSCDSNMGAEGWMR